MARAGARGVRVELGVVVRWSRGGGRGRGLRGDRAVRVWSCGVCGRGVSRAWGGSSAPGQGQRGVAQKGFGLGRAVGWWCVRGVRCGARGLILFGLVSAGGLAGVVCSTPVYGSRAVIE